MPLLLFSGLILKNKNTQFHGCTVSSFVNSAHQAEPMRSATIDYILHTTYMYFISLTTKKEIDFSIII